MTAPTTRRERLDDGFTVLELAIVLLISSIVMVAIVGMLQSQTRAERHVSAAAANQEQVRQALAEIQRDLRSAEPLVAMADSSSYLRQIELAHLDFDTSAAVRLRWRVDLARRELVREIIDPTTRAVTATTYRLSGVDVGTSFRYYGSNGSELAPSSTSSSIVALCTVRVGITIEAAPERGPRPLRASSDVNLRNRARASRLCAH